VKDPMVTYDTVEPGEEEEATLIVDTPFEISDDVI
tara:strand:+ start:305 stop:409 length:105 start_codon:yes stop_codon:yes gene_type:complete